MQSCNLRLGSAQSPLHSMGEKALSECAIAAESRCTPSHQARLRTVYIFALVFSGIQERHVFC